MQECKSQHHKVSAMHLQIRAKEGHGTLKGRHFGGMEEGLGEDRHFSLILETVKWGWHIVSVVG